MVFSSVAIADDSTHRDVNNEEEAREEYRQQLADDSTHRDVNNEEDREEYRQQLTDEVKRLASTIDDMVAVFNNKFKGLHNERISASQRILCNDLYLTLLANAAFLNNDSIHTAERVHKKILHIQGLHETSQHDLKVVQDEYNRLYSAVQCLIDEDKGMEKGFRAYIQQLSEDPLDQETVNLLFLMFRRRDFGSHDASKHISARRKRGRTAKVNVSALSRRSKLGRQSGRESLVSLSKARTSLTSNRKSYDTTSNSVFGNMKIAMEEAAYLQGEDEFVSANDPFWDFDDGKTLTTIGTGHCTVFIEAPTIDDIPEGFTIQQDVWEGMVAFREQKIAKEREVATETEGLREIRNMLEIEEAEERKLSESMSNLHNKVRSLDTERLEEMKCAEFVVSITQGQDEIEKEAVAVDYSDAIFLPTRSIDEANDSIRKLGHERLVIMQKIKTFRRIINQMKWKTELMELRNKDSKELLADYHLLRLSLELQKMLNGEVEDATETARRTENQLARQKVAHRSKLEKLQRERRAFMKSASRRIDENVQLDQQLRALKDTVAAKEKAQKSLVTSTAQAEGKMKKIMRRSKRVEKIRKQSDSLFALRNELDALRQKTFPSFSTVTKN